MCDAVEFFRTFHVECLFVVTAYFENFIAYAYQSLWIMEKMLLLRFFIV